ncbi:Polyribonucleotide nucleotidyltransferase OS=Streptomyces sp. ACT-1 OX=1609288 GN=pnp PE=3 SV=1 [Streptomyces griseus subsp. griseus]
MPEVGERYLGTRRARPPPPPFVSRPKDGLLHISQIRKLAGGKRVENVEDAGVAKVQVEIAEIDSRGNPSPASSIGRPPRPRRTTRK